MQNAVTNSSFQHKSGIFFFLKTILDTSMNRGPLGLVTFSSASSGMLCARAAYIYSVWLCR